MTGLGPAGLMILSFIGALGALIAAFALGRVARWLRGRAKPRRLPSQG
jgi:hypothetical protein